MKNCAILFVICFQVLNRGLLVIINMSRSSLISFHSFWKGRNFLICISVYCWAQLFFLSLTFSKAISILSYSFKISLLWKNNIILWYQALTSSGLPLTLSGSFIFLLASLLVKSFLTFSMKFCILVA